MNGHWSALWVGRGEHALSLIFTILFAVAFGVLIVWLCLALIRDDTGRVLNGVLALAGWALRMFFVPHSRNEFESIAPTGQTLSAFASGDVIAKCDRFLETTKFRGEEQRSAAWIRVGIVLCSVALVVLMVFSGRTYFGGQMGPPTNGPGSAVYMLDAKDAGRAVEVTYTSCLRDGIS